MKTEKEIKKKLKEMQKVRLGTTQKNHQYLTNKLNLQIDILRWVLGD